MHRLQHIQHTANCKLSTRKLPTPASGVTIYGTNPIFLASSLRNAHLTYDTPSPVLYTADGVVDSQLGGVRRRLRTVYVPYSDSALTWLLKDCFGLNCCTTLLISQSCVLYSLQLFLFAFRRQKQRLKTCIYNGTPMTELRDVACHMGSHSVTCYPTQVNAPRPNPAARRRVLDLPTPEGWKAELTQATGNVQESNWRPLDHKSDALTTTSPSHPLATHYTFLVLSISKLTKKKILNAVDVG